MRAVVSGNESHSRPRPRRTAGSAHVEIGDGRAIAADWFRAALAVRPFGEPILDAVQVAVESFPDGREVVSQVAELRSRVLSEDAIEGHLRAAQGDFAAEIEHHLKARLGDSEEDELHAAVMSRAIASALVAALDVWTRRAGGDPDELRKLTRQALDHLQRGI